ncbi:hypothetical protein [Rhodococcus sp. NPDC058514]|uniref:hypothetical protein n=1 Tax=unclassified Rhodococcus (in: high G+C Gram-positive bacteria) TaxID=192944 RepID=UPI00364A6C1B
MDRLRPAPKRVTLSCALLVGAVVFGLLAMHHVAAAVQPGVAAHGPQVATSALALSAPAMDTQKVDTPSMAHGAMPEAASAHPVPDQRTSTPRASAPSAVPADPQPADHTGGHHLLNACVAILLSVVLLVMSLISLGLPSGAGTRVQRGRAAVARTGRGPPFVASTSNRLATLCLLRV